MIKSAAVRADACTMILPQSSSAAGTEPAHPHLPAVLPSVPRLVAAGVPITLLCDLLLPDGPPSREILEAEREADEGWWLEHAYPRSAGAASRAGRAGRAG